jgi:pimeloyl-ACP methyl ester carboxylesterase
MTLTLSNTSKLQFRSGYRAYEAYICTGTLAYLVGRRLLLGLLFAVALFLPGKAHAAMSLTPCPDKSGVQCGTVTVPIDRTGSIPGTIGLHVEVLPASGFPRGTMFLIAGGPGQGSAGSFNLGPGFGRDLMRFLFPGYTLVAFDNRGTGQSAVIRCPALQSAVNPSVEQDAALAKDCADIIGPQRVFYATRDHAEDMDAVRAALGVTKIGLYGVSYGTKLAVAYALAHPANVERIVLDSVVVPTYPDPFDRNVLTQMPSTLRRFCSGGFCRGATTDFGGEVVKLANRLEARPIRGKVIAPTGRLRALKMNGEDTIELTIDADLSPGLAAELPAAVHAALTGNTRPILRLRDIDLRSNELKVEDLSFGLYAATNCADGQFPWTPDTPPAARAAILESTLAGMPSGSFGLFGNWAGRTGNAFFCAQWPSPAGSTPLAPGPLPNVPMIALNGGFDLRTPTTNALAVVSQFPQGRLIEVPGVGHSVTGQDASFCSQRALREWMLGTLNAPKLAECPRVAPVAKVLQAFPQAPKRPSVSSTLALAGKTLREAEASWWQLNPPATTLRGLYGGKLVQLKKGDGFTLTRYALAPGVFVSGKVTFADIGPPSIFKGTLKVFGPRAVAGTIKLAKNSVTGRLGGRSVRGAY